MRNFSKISLLVIIIILVIAAIKLSYLNNGTKTKTPRTATTPSPVEKTHTSENIWQTIKIISSDISPILASDSLPPGTTTQQIAMSKSGAFLVEYTGVNKKLHLGVNLFNPGEIDDKGSQSQVTVRNQRGTLQIQNTAKPTEFVWLWWEEPGTWKPAPDAPTGNKVFYMISAEGFTPQEVQQFAESLKPLN